MRAPSGSRTPSRPSSTRPTGIARSTSAAPPSWSACAWVTTSTSSLATPARRSRATTPPSGGPVSTSTLASRCWMRVASPWPTSRKVIRRPSGGAAGAPGVCTSAIAAKMATRTATPAGRRAVRDEDGRGERHGHRGDDGGRDGDLGGRHLRGGVAEPRQVAEQRLGERRERCRGGGAHLTRNAGEHAQPHHGRDDRRGEQVGGHGDERGPIEVQRDQRGCPDRRRDGHRQGLGEARRDAGTPRRTGDPGAEQDDRGDGGEAHLPAGVLDRARIERERHRGGEHQRVPAVRRAARRAPPTSPAAPITPARWIEAPAPASGT